MSDPGPNDLALVVEDVLRRWFAGTRDGRDIMRTRSLTLDEAVDAGFELLNAGFLKIVGDIGAGDGTLTLELRMPPEPPKQPFFRTRNA